MDDGCGHPINLLNENQEESHHFKTKKKKNYMLINYNHQTVSRTSTN